MIKDIKKDGYNIHIIKTNKFKTVTVKLVFWNELKEEELTIRNLLADNLLFSSKKYNDNRKLCIKRQDLYNAGIYSSTYRNGTQIITEINLSCINDKYTEKGNFKKALEFLFECINNPNIENDSFNKQAFSITKERLKAAIKNEKDNPGYYSYRRYKEIIGNKKILIGSILGSIETLNKISENDLYDYYKSFLSNNHLDIYILGNVNEKTIEQIIDENITFKINDIKYSNNSTTYEKEFSETIENSKFKQSKLLMGGSTKYLTDHEKKYTSIIYNIILGNSPNSKLFRTVREKKSYAYNISSNMNRLDGMFIINAGISDRNYEDSKNEIYKQLELMKEGDFSLKEIKNAKEAILSILKEINDSPNPIINHYHNYLYNNADTIEEQKEAIKAITKDDIIKVAKKINIDTIYLLKEDNNGKNTN